VRADLTSATLKRITADPDHPALGALCGRSALSGFRRLVDETMPGERESGSVRFQLLDDLPVALLLSGRVPRLAGVSLRRRDPARSAVDICAGWAAGGTLLAGLTDLGPPIHIGPVAPAVERADDPLGWHEHGPLAPDATRRRRRIDVWMDGEVAQVECFFRDSHADGRGAETVVHEYTVRAAVDPATMRFAGCDADPGPLPYPECPAAAASARRLEGTPVRGSRRAVLDTLVGPSTCTHLNDALRSLEDVATLVRAVRQEVEGRGDRAQNDSNVGNASGIRAPRIDPVAGGGSTTRSVP
jgi:hypothetical protein